MTAKLIDPRPECALCGHKSHFMGPHLAQEHGMTLHEYVAAHPKAPTVSQQYLDHVESEYKGMRRNAAPAITDLTVDMCGFSVPVDAGSDPDTCAMIPQAYRFPTKGKARDMMKDAVMDILDGLNVYIWGFPGTGKDGFLLALSGMARKPLVMNNIVPDRDIGPWFYQRSMDKEGTGWDFGHLWNVITKGVLGRDGVARPAIVVLTDLDRADPAQVEWLRLLMDSTQGRIVGPEGEVVNVFPGTQFVATANTNGSGDDRGRMVSAGCLDASILDRFDSAVQFSYLHWDDEVIVVREKFPELAEKAPEFIEQVGNATRALREAIDKDELYAEFSHRAVCSVLSRAERMLRRDDSMPAKFGARAFRAWTHKLDADNRLIARRLIDPHLSGGALDDSSDSSY